MFCGAVSPCCAVLLGCDVCCALLRLFLFSFKNHLIVFENKSRIKKKTSKQSDSRDRGLISSLPVPYCTNSLLYVDFIHGLPHFSGYDSCLVVTRGLSRFTRVFT